MRNTVLLLALALSCSPICLQAHAAKYDQPLDKSGITYNSMNYVPAANLFNVADDFVCTQTGLITEVSWYGSYFYMPGPMDIAGFNIRFYADDRTDGLEAPGTLLYDVECPGNANEDTTGVFDADGYEIFSYTQPLPTDVPEPWEPFEQVEGETYWISISVIPGPEWEDPDPNISYWGLRTAPSVTGDPGVQADYDDADHEGMWDGALSTGHDFAFALTTGDQPPELTVTANPHVLWPPNHNMVLITVDHLVTDDTDPSPTVELVSVESTEPDDADGGGDGHTVNDIQMDPSGDIWQVWVRAERDGQGSGRFYLFTYRATDATGHSTTAQTHVFVPHDNGQPHVNCPYCDE
jgi:hypothetical protein